MVIFYHSQLLIYYRSEKLHYFFEQQRVPPLSEKVHHLYIQNEDTLLIVFQD